MPHLYTYIYKLYLRICVPIIPLIIKAPPPNIHSLKKEWKPKGCHSNNKGNGAPWTPLIYKSQLFLKYTEIVHISGWLYQVFIDLLWFFIVTKQGNFWLCGTPHTSNQLLCPPSCNNNLHCHPVPSLTWYFLKVCCQNVVSCYRWYSKKSLFLAHSRGA